MGWGAVPPRLPPRGEGWGAALEPGCPTLAWLWEGSVDQEMCVQSGLDRCHGGEGSQETSLLSSPRPKNGFTGDKGVRQKQTWSSCEDRAASFSPPIGEAHLPPRNRLAALVTSVGSASGTCVTWARAWCASCGQLVSKVRGEGPSSFGEGLPDPQSDPGGGSKGREARALRKSSSGGGREERKPRPPRPCLSQLKNAGPNSFVFGRD